MPPGYEASGRPDQLQSLRVRWKTSLNRVLVRTTGHQLERAQPAARARRPNGQGGPAATSSRPGPPTVAAEPPRAVADGDRLVTAPVFILCSMRSGSTLLRVLLNSHPEIHAPHELHLRYVRVRLRGYLPRRSMQELGLDADGLRYLLWDRLLQRELSASGKRIIVDKTPNNVFIPFHLRACWPDARFVFLLRHPAAIVRSRRNLRPGIDHDRNVERIRRYCAALEQARQTYDGHTIRYEDLTADPEGVLRGVCGFLGVPWDPAMLDYGRQDHGPYRAGLGDWADKIRTGQVQPPAPPPAETPAPLRELARAWGYQVAGEAPLVR
jgi:hypothetical protein